MRYQNVFEIFTADLWLETISRNCSVSAQFAAFLYG